MNTAISPEIKIESPVSPISTENGGYICSLCGTRGDLKSTILGSFIVEALLWLCFIVPGIMYSSWRSSTRKRGCKTCRSEQMIPYDSPEGKLRIKKYTNNAA